jgi:hypothetical protein
MSERRRYEVSDLVEAVRDLTASRQHRQRYRAGWTRANRTGPVIRDHVTDQKSLIAQLRGAITDRPDTSAGTVRSAYRSLPKFSADVYDRMEAIRQGVTQWCEHLGMPSESARMAREVNQYLTAVERIIEQSRTMAQPAMDAIGALRVAAALIRAAIEPDLLAIVESAPRMEPATLDAITVDACRWRTWCRVMTGWQDPPVAPYVPCLRCGQLPDERAGLRVRIEGASGSGGIVGDAAVQAAVCLSCNATWDADTIGLLAEHIRMTKDLGTSDLGGT